MTILPILLWPDPKLSEVCDLVKNPQSVADLAEAMFETMYSAPGRGLAAPQVGQLLRLFVMDAGWKEGTPSPMTCLNPRITARSDAMATRMEGCLSMPGVEAQVTRPDQITMRYTDLGGQRQEVTLSGPAATIAQHEIDHLDGIMHFDRLEPDARIALLGAYDQGQA